MAIRLSMMIASFPGAPHVSANATIGPQGEASQECGRWVVSTCSGKSTTTFDLMTASESSLFAFWGARP